MLPRPLTLLSFLLLGFFGISQSANADLCGNDTGAYSTGSKYTITDFTYYIPSLGGINGSCGKSASPQYVKNKKGKVVKSKKPIDGCKHPIENYAVTWVMGAVAQKRGSSGMFGGLYRARALEKALGKSCIVVGAGDRYGPGSNGKTKMDILSSTKRHPSAMQNKINNAHGEMIKIGTIKDGLPDPQREITRASSADQCEKDLSNCRKGCGKDGDCKFQCLKDHECSANDSSKGASEKKSEKPPVPKERLTCQKRQQMCQNNCGADLECLISCQDSIPCAGDIPAGGGTAEVAAPAASAAAPMSTEAPSSSVEQSPGVETPAATNSPAVQPAGTQVMCEISQDECTEACNGNEPCMIQCFKDYPCYQLK